MSWLAFGKEGDSNSSFSIFIEAFTEISNNNILYTNMVENTHRVLKTSSP